MFLLLACTDYELTKETRDPRGRPPLEDTAVDTDADTTAADTSEPDDATIPSDDTTEPCSTTRTVRVGLSADDIWVGWLAGTEFGNVEHWWETTWTEFELECGTYVLAAYATDAHQAISGFIGQVEVEGTIVTQTGDGTWLVHEGDPGGSDWHHSRYDDSAWGPGVLCEVSAATGWWGSSPADLTSAGAWWIWPHDCLALGSAGFRVWFTVE